MKEGQKAKLYVDVKASSGEKIKYNWQKYDNEENTYISIDNTTDTYTTDAISSEERYRCVITCNGEEYNSEFMIGVEGENDNTFETSSYIKVNGEEVVDDTAEVRSGSNITLGVNIRQLPSGIKESDVSYAWYKGDAGSVKIHGQTGKIRKIVFLQLMNVKSLIFLRQLHIIVRLNWLEKFKLL